MSSELIDLWRARWRARVVDENRELTEPWALPLVVRVERASPPTHRDALGASALAVVRLLLDENSAPTGPWFPEVARWSSGWIRKVVRRARGVRWTEAAQLPGVEAILGSARVRALVPHPVSAPPPALDRLQVQGLDLTDRPDDDAPRPAEPDTREPASGTAHARTVLTIALDPDVRLTTGKACAQVGHAAQLALLELDRDRVQAWVDGGLELRISLQDREIWHRMTDGSLPSVPVHDAGFTEVAPGTLTCAASFGRPGRPD